MIHFLTTRRNPRTIETYLRKDGAPLASLFALWTYDRLPARPAPGTYCFADLEILTPDERERAVALSREVAARGPRLNDPEQWLGRYALLRTLRRHGSNRFDVHRVGEPPRFPVFLRGEHDHDGSRTPLLRTQAELCRALLEAGDDTLVVEFCDTADGAGVYRKYGAFVVGDRVLPRHLFFSRGWVVKEWDLLDDAMLLEERRYLETNPHEQALREVAAIAGIRYGRIDYGLLDGSVQVFEINTNPVLLGIGPSVRPWWEAPLARLRGSRKRPPGRPRALIHAIFAAAVDAAWREIAAAGP